jgi:hypothetical protein
MKRPPAPQDLDAMETEVAACIARLRDQHAEITAVLLECAGFPMVAAEVRCRAKLPVYEITHLCRMLIDSVVRKSP